MGKIEIAYLADYPDFIEACASWAYGQWGCQSGGSLKWGLARFAHGAGKERLPLTLIALEAGKPAGMVSLWESDFDKKPELSPWLASLYVHPFHRGKQIASALIKRVEQEASLLGYSELYLITEEAEGLYSKHDWKVLEQVETSFGKGVLMTKQFKIG